MSKLPVISGKEAVKAFSRIGYEVVRQKGSHIRMRDEKNVVHLPLTIPNHKVLKPGLVHSLVKQAGISIEEFRKLL